jgi:hypothetical protein
MTARKARCLSLVPLALLLIAAHAQTPQQAVQLAVDTERAANQADHSQWIYLEQNDTPSQHTLGWVASTPSGNVERVLERDGQPLPEPQQLDRIQHFLRDPHAQKKQLADTEHDTQQIDDFLKLLPIAFLWTQTAATADTTTFHFEPAPGFTPPTRPARVFSSMAGELVVDNQQHRIRAASGHLLHNVVFGAGLLGKLNQGSSFSLEQAQVAPSTWEFTAIHVHLSGTALLFKTISLQQDDERSRYQPEPATITLGQAATQVMSQPATASFQPANAPNQMP